MIMKASTRSDHGCRRSAPPPPPPLLSPAELADRVRLVVERARVLQGNIHTSGRVVEGPNPAEGKAPKVLRHALTALVDHAHERLHVLEGEGERENEVARPLVKKDRGLLVVVLKPFRVDIVKSLALLKDRAL